MNVTGVLEAYQDVPRRSRKFRGRSRELYRLPGELHDDFRGVSETLKAFKCVTGRVRDVSGGSEAS